MNKLALICCCSEAYLSRYKILYDSIIKWVPNCTPILYYGGVGQPDVNGTVYNVNHWINDTQYNNDFYRYCTVRPKAVLDAFKRGYTQVILLGADTEFFDYPAACIKALQRNDCFVTMYIHEPYTGNQELFGNNLQCLENGQINADLIGFRKSKQVIKFVKWVAEQTAKHCEIKEKVYVDQAWWSMCFSFLDKVKVIRDKGYNVAHYNLFQRQMNLKNGKWVLRKNTPLVLFHYAGLTKGSEEKISKHQNRYKASGNLLQFLKDYTDKW